MERNEDFDNQIPTNVFASILNETNSTTSPSTIATPETKSQDPENTTMEKDLTTDPMISPLTASPSNKQVQDCTKANGKDKDNTSVSTLKTKHVQPTSLQKHQSSTEHFVKLSSLEENIVTATFHELEKIVPKVTFELQNAYNQSIEEKRAIAIAVGFAEKKATIKATDETAKALSNEGVISPSNMETLIESKVNDKLKKEKQKLEAKYIEKFEKILKDNMRKNSSGSPPDQETNAVTYNGHDSKQPSRDLKQYPKRKSYETTHQDQNLNQQSAYNQGRYKRRHSHHQSPTSPTPYDNRPPLTNSNLHTPNNTNCHATSNNHYHRSNFNSHHQSFSPTHHRSNFYSHHQSFSPTHHLNNHYHHSTGSIYHQTNRHQNHHWYRN